LAPFLLCGILGAKTHQIGKARSAIFFKSFKVSAKVVAAFLFSIFYISCTQFDDDVEDASSIDRKSRM